LELAKSDAITADNIFNIIEKLQEGKGLQAEMLQGKKSKIKKLALGDKLYELREYSTKLRKQIRIYFSIDSNNKKWCSSMRALSQTTQDRIRI
jgi:hypothetical protein